MTEETKTPGPLYWRVRAIIAGTFFLSAVIFPVRGLVAYLTGSWLGPDPVSGRVTKLTVYGRLIQNTVYVTPGFAAVYNFLQATMWASFAALLVFVLIAKKLNLPLKRPAGPPKP